MGRHEEGLTFAERARRVDPVSPFAQMNMATIHYFARRYDEAIADLEPRSISLLILLPRESLLRRVYAAKGMPDRASTN